MTNLLSLGGIKAKSVDKDEHDYLIRAEVIDEPDVCPKCVLALPDLYRHGTAEMRVMDTPMHGKRVGILLERQRFRCRECDSTFIYTPSVIVERHRMTLRLFNYIGRRATQRPFAEVAEDVGIDEKTVRNCFHEWVDFHDEIVRVETPRWLGLDEIHLLGAPRAILTNVEEQTILDLLRSRKKEYLGNYLRNMPAKGRVEIVVIDMWRPYRDLSNEIFERAQVTVDKFHVVSLASKSLETVRKRLCKNMEAKKRRELMGSRFLALKRRSKLDEREQLLLEGMIGHLPLLHAAYQAKESFYKVFERETETQARRAYGKWLDRLPEKLEEPFTPLTRAMYNWEEEIFAYFNSGVTNGYTEGLNSAIRTINRMGRGYSFEAIRGRALYGLGRQERPKFGDTLLEYQPSLVETAFGTTQADFGVPFSTIASEMKEGHDG